MYIRNPERVEWIQNLGMNINDNLPKYDTDRKKHILKKLNEAVSFEGFCIPKIFVFRGGAPPGGQKKKKKGGFHWKVI